MGIRYDNRIIRTNSQEIYKDLLKKRGLKKVKQYTTPILGDISEKDRMNLDRLEHLWVLGDKLYKLADKYYGDPELWWLIAWYNQRPTEADYVIGDIVYIPLPLEEILDLYYQDKTSGGE